MKLLAGTVLRLLLQRVLVMVPHGVVAGPILKRLASHEADDVIGGAVPRDERRALALVPKQVQGLPEE